jgi:hypothetical protein
VVAVTRSICENSPLHIIDIARHALFRLVVPADFGDKQRRMTYPIRARVQDSKADHCLALRALQHNAFENVS